MAIFAPLTGQYLIPQKWLLSKTPAIISAVDSLHWAGFVTYLPMFLRLTMYPKGNSYNNENPRAQLSKLLSTDSSFSRMHAAHLNGLEQFPFFAAAILSGVHAGISAKRLSKIATLWLILRFAYIPMYLVQNKRTSGLRSLIFFWAFCLSCNLMKESATKLLQDRKQD